MLDDAMNSEYKVSDFTLSKMLNHLPGTAYGLHGVPPHARRAGIALCFLVIVYKICRILNWRNAPERVHVICFRSLHALKLWSLKRSCVGRRISGVEFYFVQVIHWDSHI